MLSQSRESGFSLLQLLLSLFGLLIVAAVLYLFLPADTPSVTTDPAETAVVKPEPDPEPDFTVAELQQLKPTAGAGEEVKQLLEDTPVTATDGTEPLATDNSAAQSPADNKTPLPLEWQGGGNLNSSDSLVRDALKQLDPSQQLLRWLVSDELLRRFVVLVDNLANGHLPSKYMVLKAPASELAVTPAGEEYLLDSANFERYGVYFDVLAAMPPKSVVSAYQQFYPLLQQAYAELGYPRRSFHHRMLAAIEQVLNTPMPEPGVELMLTRSSVMYQYQDETLEQSSDVQKLLLRMGPKNSAMLKESLWQWKRLLIQLDHR